MIGSMNSSNQKAQILLAMPLFQLDKNNQENDVT